jgi:uncharacterized Ntn-hydrolase superfamily protein
MAVLEAGQEAGGDARGMQAGAIYIVKPIEDPSTSTDKWIDIRVDDSPNPFRELRRLLNISLAGRQSLISRRLADEGKFEEAIEAQKKAAAMNPSDDQLVYGLAGRYAQAGETASALETLKQAVSKHAGWREFVTTNPEFERIKSDPAFKKLVGS